MRRPGPASSDARPADHQGQGRAPTNSSASCWQLRYSTIHVGFSTLLRTGSQNLPCRSLRSRGIPFRPVRASRVAASVHDSFATWLHGDGQFLVRPNPSYGRRRPVPDMPLSDVESVPKRSLRDLCRLTVEYGDGGHCAKLDKRITVAHTVLAHFGCTPRRS